MTTIAQNESAGTINFTVNRKTRKVQVYKRNAGGVFVKLNVSSEDIKAFLGVNKVPSSLTVPGSFIFSNVRGATRKFEAPSLIAMQALLLQLEQGLKYPDTWEKEVKPVQWNCQRLLLKAVPQDALGARWKGTVHKANGSTVAGCEGSSASDVRSQLRKKAKKHNKRLNYEARQRRGNK